MATLAMEGGGVLIDDRVVGGESVRPQGEPAGTMENIWLDPFEPLSWGSRQCYAVYQLGALYVRCRVFAYHLDSSRIQHLGHSYPKCYSTIHSNGIYETFVYTPYISRQFHAVTTGAAHPQHFHLILRNNAGHSVDQSKEPAGMEHPTNLSGDF
uniref:Uncharacterized protein n=1 Tax=Oryza nivara TaxID=4536 RepID=A0A0E0J4L3_ORYNI